MSEGFWHHINEQSSKYKDRYHKKYRGHSETMRKPSQGGHAIQASISVLASDGSLLQQVLQKLRLRTRTMLNASFASVPVSHWVRSLMQVKDQLVAPGGAKCIRALGTFLTAQFHISLYCSISGRSSTDTMSIPRHSELELESVSGRKGRCRATPVTRPSEAASVP